MIVIDTGVLFAAADRSDTHHERCSEFFDNTREALRVPTPVVIETAWLIRSRLGVDEQTPLPPGDIRPTGHRTPSTMGSKRSSAAAWVYPVVRHVDCAGFVAELVTAAARWLHPRHCLPIRAEPCGLLYVARRWR